MYSPFKRMFLFLDLDFSFTRLGSQHLSFHPVFWKKTSFSTEKIEFMVISCAASEQSNMIQHWHQSPLLVFSGWKPPNGQDVTTWLQIFHLQKQKHNPIGLRILLHVGHLFIVPPICRHFDAFWNSIDAFYSIRFYTFTFNVQMYNHYLLITIRHIICSKYHFHTFSKNQSHPSLEKNPTKMEVELDMVPSPPGHQASSRFHLLLFLLLSRSLWNPGVTVGGIGFRTV